MDILRRNTDYALRLMVGLARRGADASVSTRVLAQEQEVSYQLACKLMQQLHDAGLVQSSMGPKGGFRLGRAAAQISLLEIIEAVQGPVSVNRCLLNETCCPRQETCPVRVKMGELQQRMGEYLGGVTLADLAAGRPARMKETAGGKT
ncbi:MAG: Rrf2 family transcriptional regulator [Planctomycetes bacterium]|jgi:Rrf2 family protein|nr:Rrf2 family transcriptional regulator [Planctomycetota bacterium]